MNMFMNSAVTVKTKMNKFQKKFAVQQYLSVGQSNSDNHINEGREYIVTSDQSIQSDIN